jgi:branched-chain amino acid transport system permease protein
VSTPVATPEAGGPRLLGRVALGAVQRRSVGLKIAVIALLLLWPLFSDDIYTLSWMTTAGLFLMLTIAAQLIISQAGQLSFGHAAFYGIGAYTAGLLVTKTQVPTLLALVAAPIVTVVIALVIGRPVLRLKYFYLTLATIALASITGILVTQSQWAGGTIGLGPFPTLDVFGFEFGTYARQYYLVWVIALLILLLTQRALMVRFGRSLRAIATSEVAATTMGVRAPNWKLVAFAAGAAYCGLAGALFAFVFSAVSPTMFAFSAALIPVIMMLIGGADTLWGGLVGALLMTYITNRLTSAQQYSGLIYSVILILLLLFLPMGLAGLVRRDRLERLKMVVTRRRQPDGVAETVAADSGELAEQREVSIALPIYEHADVAHRGAAGGPGENALLDELAERAASASGRPLLVVEDVSVVFGGLHAVDGVSLTVSEGEIHALIGPNGAGKTTLFNVISRLQKPSAGAVRFMDRNVTHLTPADVARLGMARTFQNLRIFANMSVLENVLVGCHRHERSGLVSGALGLPSQRREEKESLARATGALRLVGMEGSAGLPAASLPYGQQRLVEIARALASEPRVLLLDEPAAGMNAS